MKKANLERKPPDMYAIVRHWSALDGRQLGWKVAFMRLRKAYRKDFSASRYGGLEAALEAAKAWRDEMSLQAPVRTKRKVSAEVRKHNTSGFPGVYLKTFSRKTAEGVRYNKVWLALTPNQIKPPRTKSFSIAIYGYEKALELAVAARREFVRELGNRPLAPRVPKALVPKSEAEN